MKSSAEDNIPAPWSGDLMETLLLNPTYLQQTELADRWRLSPRTLERWRWLKTGPSYVKLGGRVVYAVSDVEAYERRQRAETHTSILGAWR